MIEVSYASSGWAMSVPDVNADEPETIMLRFMRVKFGVSSRRAIKYEFY